MIFFLLSISKELSSLCPNKISPYSDIIRDFEFENCLNLKGPLNIYENITYIGDYAFYHCINLNGSLKLHNKIQKIGKHAFDGCMHLTGSLELPENLNSLGEGAFYGCTGFTGSLKIPAYFSSSIPRYCFFQCSGFDELIFTNYYNDNVCQYKKEHSDYSLLQKLSDPIFIKSQYNYEFKKYFPYITKIGEYAFYKCSGLKIINLLYSIETIEKYSFFQCTNLEKINIWYVDNALKTYKLFQSNSFTLPMFISTIGESAFANCFKLKNPLTIPETLQKIEENAFRNCFSIEGALSILGSTIICDHAFDGCSSFTSLELGSSISYIGSYAFNGCSGFNCSLKLPENLKMINNYAFGFCSGFHGSLEIKQHIIHIGNGAFKNCYGFNESLVIYNIETKIGSSAFYNCSGFRGSLMIPRLINTIKKYTFFNCSGFSGPLILPTKLNKIGEYAFSNCSGLSESLYIPENTIQICSYAFSGCTGLNGILTISQSVKKIGENAFLSNKFIKIIYYGKLEPLCNNSIGFSHDEIIFVKKYYQNNSFCSSKVQNCEILQMKKNDIKNHINNNFTEHKFGKINQNQKILSESKKKNIKTANNKNSENFSIYNNSQINRNISKLQIKKVNRIKKSAIYHEINDSNVDILTELLFDNIISTNNTKYENSIKTFFLILSILIIVFLALIINSDHFINKSESTIQNERIENNLANPHSYNHIDIETFNKLKLKGCKQIGNYSVYIVSDGPYYVIKELDDFKKQFNFFNEYDIIHKLDHINIINAYGICYGDRTHPSSILLEYCPFTLSNFIDKLSNEDKISIIYEISIAMSFVHKENVIHRDLKPSNILITEKMHVKICDFGISKRVEKEMSTYTHQIGTPKFMAPEMIYEIYDEPYGFEVDVFSFGVIVFMILSDGHFPDKSNNNFERYKINNTSKELIEQCLSKSPKDRPTFNEIINYIKNTNFQLIDEVNNDLIKSHLNEIYDDIY